MKKLWDASETLGDCDEDSSIAEATHLILGEKKRTYKVLAAIARGLWIVSPDWIKDSIKQGKWLDEAKYESKFYSGASKSRQIHSKNKDLLFLNTKVYVNQGKLKLKDQELKE